MQERMSYATSVLVCVVLLLTCVPRETTSQAVHLETPETFSTALEEASHGSWPNSPRLSFPDIQDPSLDRSDGPAFGDWQPGPQALQALGLSITPSWHTACIDCPKWFGKMSDRSLRLDEQGHPHIAYGRDFLYYAWHDGSVWHYETVDATGEVGEYAALALDGGGRPHIGYYDSRDADLKYAWHDGTSWHCQTVDSEGSVGRHVALALDATGRPHISYHGGDGLKYAWHDGTAWQFETVAPLGTDGYEGWDITLALDGADRPHIVYDGGSDLGYAWHDGASWQVEAIQNTPSRGEYISLVLDGSDRPHVIYGGYDLGYARRNGSTWQVEVLSGDDWLQAGFVSLALDSAGWPHISYLRGSNQSLEYMWYDGGTWQLETVDDVGWYQGMYYDWINAPTSLALDGVGHPHISYFDLRDRTLKYARHDGTSWHYETVDSEGSVGQGSLELDSSQRPHIAYVRCSDNGNACSLKYASHDGVVWHDENVEEAVQAYGLSLALDGLDRPHIAYLTNNSFYRDLVYARHDGAQWITETVRSAVKSSRYDPRVSLALDGAGHPHIAYGDHNLTLMYARHDGVQWITEKAAELGDQPSLALDSAGHPHIAYEDTSNYALKYVWRDGGTWRKQTVDSGLWEDMYASLALDRLGRPHISYRDWGDYAYDLKYAWYDGTHWHITVVDNKERAGEYSSLALDGMGRPHISYMAGGWDPEHLSYDYDLRYAWHDGANWQIETVVSRGIVGWGALLALDSADRPHIGYYDYSNCDLKYAWRTLLSLGKQAAPSDGLDDGDVLTYTLVLSGPGLNVHLFDPLPAGVEYITNSVTSPATYSLTADAIIWQGQLPTDTVQVIDFRVMVGTSGAEKQPIVNRAWLTDTESGAGLNDYVLVNARRRYFPLVARKGQW